MKHSPAEVVVEPAAPGTYTEAEERANMAALGGALWRWVDQAMKEQGEVEG